MAAKIPTKLKGRRASKTRGHGYAAIAVFLSAIAVLSLLPSLTMQLVSTPAPLGPVTATASAARSLGSGARGGEGGNMPETGTYSGGMTKGGQLEGGKLQGMTRSLAGISHKGEGGKLRDGRDRCFIDDKGLHRCYPTVFFFGTSKCGTTSLARWLDAHPATHWVANPRRPHQIEQTGVKEAHVFDDPPPDGSLWSRQESLHEKLHITTPKVNADSVVVDYTPHYLAVAESPYRISDMYGGQESGLKFVVTLRAPSNRTVSSWQFKNEFNSKKGRREEPRTLAKAVRDGMKRASILSSCVDLAKEKGIPSRVRDILLCNPRNLLEKPMFLSHVGKGMFALQLERWFEMFGRENFKVVFTDDMAADPLEVLKDVLSFLGLDLTSEDESQGLPNLKEWRKITGMAYNKTKSKKKDELGDQVTDGVRRELDNFFEPHNRALEALLGTSVPDGWN